MNQLDSEISPLNLNASSLNLETKISYRTDNELTSSDESEVEDAQSYSYTRFRIRDHIRSFFGLKEANPETPKEGSQKKPSHLISCSATKMVIKNHHDTLVFEHLRHVNRLRKPGPGTFPSRWTAWILQDHGIVSKETKLSNLDDLRGFFSLLRANHESSKRVHILRSEMTLKNKSAFSDSTVFMKVTSASSLSFYGTLCQTFLSDKLSQPMSVHISVIGISLGKATEEYSIVILWLAKNVSEEYHQKVYRMLSALTNELDERYTDTIKTSVFVDNKTMEADDIFTEES